MRLEIFLINYEFPTVILLRIFSRLFHRDFITRLFTFIAFRECSSIKCFIINEQYAVLTSRTVLYALFVSRRYFNKIYRYVDI